MPVLEYDFRVVGAQNVMRAISGIERRAVQSAGRMARVAGGGTAASPAAAAQEMRNRQRMIDQQVRSQGALMRQRVKEAKAVEQSEQRAFRIRQRSIDQQVRSQQSLARQRHREEQASLRAIRAERQARFDFARSTVGGGMSRAAGAMRAVGGLGAAAAGIGGAAVVASSVSQAMQLDEMTRRLSIAGRGKGQRGVDPEAMRRQFTQTGIATGFAPERIAAGAAGFVAKTGDLDTALKNQGVFATVAQGAGAQVEEVFSAAADLSTKLDISSVEQMSEAFAILSSQGKKGAFELKAMAGEFPEVLASAASAGVKGIGGVRDVGAIMQIARSASGSDSEASTAVQTMFRQVAAKSADIQSGKIFGGGKGVQVFEGGDAKNPMRNFATVVGDILERSGGDITQLQEIFDVRGIKAVNPMIAAFREASSKAGGGAKGAAAGREAIDKMFGDMRNVSGDFSELQRDANDAMKSFSIQMEIFNTQLKDAIASQLFPELVKLAPKMKELIPHVSKLTGELIALGQWAAENPLSGLSTVIGAAFALELGNAGIAAAMKAAFTGAAAGGIALTGAVTLAAASVSLALDQASSLNKEVGGSGESLNPFANKSGKMSLGSFVAGSAELVPVLGSVVSAMRGEDSIAFRAGKSALETGAGLLDFFGSDIARPDSQRGSGMSIDEQIAKDASDRKAAADAFGEALKLKAGEAGDILIAKVEGAQGVNRSDKPSGVKPN